MSKYFQPKRTIPNWSLDEWVHFLEGLGFPLGFAGELKPCPICLGEDRFTFNVYRGKVRWFCRNPEGVHETRNPNGYAAGDPVGLMMQYFGWTFSEAMKSIEGDIQTVVRPKYVQKKNVVKEKRAELKKAAFKLQSLVKDLIPLGDPDAELARAYLESRGLIELKRSAQGEYWAWLPDGDIGFHPNAFGITKDKELFFNPAIVCLITNKSGKVIGAHKTFLTEDAKKIEFASPKQLTRIAPSLVGGCVRLWLESENQNQLLVGEGIESTLAACRLFHLRGVAALNAGMMQSVDLKRMKRLVIAADHDVDKREQPEDDGFLPAGQAAATKLLSRLVGLGWPDVSIKLPPVGKDFNDVLLAGRVAA